MAADLSGIGGRGPDMAGRMAAQGGDGTIGQKGEFTGLGGKMQVTNNLQSASFLTDAHKNVPIPVKQGEAKLESFKGADKSESKDDSGEVEDKDDKKADKKEKKDIQQRRVSDVDKQQQKKREGYWARLAAAKLAAAMSQHLEGVEHVPASQRAVTNWQELLELNTHDADGKPLPPELANSDVTNQYDAASDAAKRGKSLMKALELTKNKGENFSELTSDEVDSLAITTSFGSRDIKETRDETLERLKGDLADLNTQFPGAETTGKIRGLRDFTDSIDAMLKTAMQDVDFRAEVVAGRLFDTENDTVEAYREAVIKHEKVSQTFGLLMDIASKGISKTET